MSRVRSAVAIVVVGILAMPWVSGCGEGDKASHDAVGWNAAAFGFPPADRPWEPQDYAVAAKALDVLAATNPSRLPRYGASGKEGDLFARMVAFENLSLPLNTRSVSLPRRLEMAVAYVDGVKPLLAAYARASSSAGFYGDELVELMRHLLEAVDTAFVLLDEYLPTLDRRARGYSARVAGFERFKAGVGTMVAGAITTLGEHQRYRTKTLTRFADGLRELLPRVLRSLPESRRNEAARQLERISGSAPLQQRPSLLALKAAIRAD